MITFHTLRFKNILSVGDDFIEIDFEEAKTTLIIGENGVGKSTLIEALVYGLYGKPFRKINLPQLVNSINKRNMLVEVEFTAMGKRYMVRRGAKPAVFEIYENGTLINQASSLKDYQAYLEAYIVKMTYKSFIHIVILGSANYTPFMELPAQDRRKITEEFIDLDIFSVMNSILKDRVVSAKLAHTDLKFDLQSIAERIEEKERSIKTVTASRDTIASEIDIQISDATAKAEAIGESIAQHERWLLAANCDMKRMREVEDAIKYCNDTAIKLEMWKGRSRESINAVEHETCHECGQAITAEHKHSTIENAQAHIADLEAQERTNNEKHEELNRELEGLETECVRRRNVEAKLNSERMRAAGQFDIIMNLEASKKKLETAAEDIMKIEGEIAELESTYTDLEFRWKRRANELDVYEYATALLKDSGIKARIIRQYVPIINSILNKYLSTMEFSVSFEIDEEFKESIKSRFQDEFSYASFSQGEKARIDLALLFTWRALAQMRNKAHTNLLILDEVFDGSLDGAGGDDLLSILEEVTKGTHIFVITHKTDAYVERFERVMRVRKKQNFTDIRLAA